MTKPYEVYCFSPDNPQHLEQWLQGNLLEAGLRLVAVYGNFWIFEQTILLDNSTKVGSFAVDAMESYGEFYDKAVIALGYSSASLPSSEMDDMMLEKIADLFWATRHLADALKITYEKLPSHWRDTLPFSYHEIMSKVKRILK